MSDFDEFTHHHQTPSPSEPLMASDLKRLDINTPSFQERLKTIGDLEEISKRLGQNKAELQICTRIREELSAVILYSDRSLVDYCSDHILEWFKDKNPYRIDLVMATCAAHGIEPTPTIIKLATKVAAARLEGSLSGTAEKLLKEHVKNRVFTLMMNLIFHGESLTSAGAKAIAWQKKHFPQIKTGRASSLTKEYSEQFRKKPKGRNKSIEAEIFSSWKKSTEANKAAWKKIARELPMPDAVDDDGNDLIGTRR